MLSKFEHQPIDIELKKKEQITACIISQKHDLMFTVIYNSETEESCLGSYNF